MQAIVAANKRQAALEAALVVMRQQAAAAGVVLNDDWVPSAEPTPAASDAAGDLAVQYVQLLLDFETLLAMGSTTIAAGFASLPDSTSMLVKAHNPKYMQGMETKLAALETKLQIEQRWLPTQREYQVSACKLWFTLCILMRRHFACMHAL
jgi:hypothetical protein